MYEDPNFRRDLKALARLQTDIRLAEHIQACSGLSPKWAAQRPLGPIDPTPPPRRQPRPFRPASSDALTWGPRYPSTPDQWSPTLILNPSLVTAPTGTAATGNWSTSGDPTAFRISLVTREMTLPPDSPHLFFLDREYHLVGVLPRSYFVVLKLNRVPHQFVFDFPDHPWFRDLFGLRKSAYVRIRVDNSNEDWDLHLKPSLDSSNLFGYIYKRSNLQRIVVEQQRALLHSRRLPLVFDLDDTLVRVVANNDGRYVPEKEAAKVPHRVRELEDGRKIVLGERVHEFLEWAHHHYEISVCSLGDPSYVKMVVKILDPTQTWIKGILYSARQEYNHHAQQSSRHRPPKDLLALYAYCTLTPEEYQYSMLAPTDRVPFYGGALGASSPPARATSMHLPLVVDDMPQMWATDQHDNVISVRDRRGQGVWDVALYPMVYNVLSFVHTEFFRRLDIHQANPREFNNAPSALAIYKEYLRGMLRDQIGSTPAVPRPLAPPTPASSSNSSVGSNATNGGTPIDAGSYPAPPPVPTNGRHVPNKTHLHEAGVSHRTADPSASHDRRMGPGPGSIHRQPPLWATTNKPNNQPAYPTRQ